MHKQPHLTHSVIMVRPHDFAFNEQTGSDNEFQHNPSSPSEAMTLGKLAMAEFETMVDTLTKSDLEVLVLDKPDISIQVPDAVFPNNWFSTTAYGKLFIYPMKTPNRQAEVQQPQLERLLTDNNYQIDDVIDLRGQQLASGHSARALEGTGSLIFHHPTATIFAAISERCDRLALEQFAAEQFAGEQQFQIFPFESQSQSGKPVYHTNVLMSCGENFAIIAQQILRDNTDSIAMMKHLNETVEDVICISEQQMAESFCGNILQLRDRKQQPMILMSESAYKGFSSRQLTKLEQHGSIIVCSIPTIEYVGGGSSRCMVAENFLVKM